MTRSFRMQNVSVAICSHIGIRKSCIPVDILSGCFWVVRRDALNDVGLLDESFFIYGEDMDWCKRFWDAGWPAVFVPQAQAIHYGGASSANAPVRFFIEMQRADLQYWTKHHSRLAVGAYSAICFLNHGLRAIGFALAFLFARRRAVARGLKHKVQRSVACLKWMANGRRHERARGDSDMRSVERQAWRD